MREILFRGKRVDGGGWVEGQLIKYKEGAMDINFIAKENKFCVVD